MNDPKVHHDTPHGKTKMVAVSKELVPYSVKTLPYFKKNIGYRVETFWLEMHMWCKKMS